MGLTGILLIDKEEGWTSQDVVSKLRGILHEKRIGHAGTLDPLATGLLVVLVGRATRAAQYAEAETKTYECLFRPGIVTDTQDITGTVLQESGIFPSEEDIRQALPFFCGTLLQMPPMYSAIKINGQKLYDIARRGGTVERTPREITVHSLEYLGSEQGGHRLRIVCSKGTYIRTLCHDLGEHLGCGGCMAELRRTSSGRFCIENALRIGDVTQDSPLLSIETLFSNNEALSLDAGQERLCRCGNPFHSDVPDGRYRFVSEAGEFLAIGNVSGRTAVTEKSFFEVSK